MDAFILEKRKTFGAETESVVVIRFNRIEPRRPRHFRYIQTESAFAGSVIFSDCLPREKADDIPVRVAELRRQIVVVRILGLERDQVLPAFTVVAPGKILRTFFNEIFCFFRVFCLAPVTVPDAVNIMIAETVVE